MNNLYKNNDWNPIRNLLKEKYHPNNQAENIANKDISGADYWNRFQKITGKTKEQIQTELRTF